MIVSKQIKMKTMQEIKALKLDNELSFKSEFLEKKLKKYFCNFLFFVTSFETLHNNMGYS